MARAGMRGGAARARLAQFGIGGGPELDESLLSFPPAISCTSKPYNPLAPTDRAPSAVSRPRRIPPARLATAPPAFRRLTTALWRVQASTNLRWLAIPITICLTCLLARPLHADYLYEHNLSARTLLDEIDDEADRRAEAAAGASSSSARRV